MARTYRDSHTKPKVSSAIVNFVISVHVYSPNVFHIIDLKVLIAELILRYIFFITSFLRITQEYQRKRTTPPSKNFLRTRVSLSFFRG